MTMLVFVDESERSSYLLCAAVLHRSDLDAVRRRLRELRRPGQRRLHFSKERDSRRREIIAVLTALPVRAVIYECRHGSAVEARSACLRRLADDMVGAERLVLETQDGQVGRDRAVLFRVLGGVSTAPAYLHVDGRTEPLLWCADAVAWAYGAGGGWRRRIGPLVDRVVPIQPETRETRPPTVRRRAGSTSAR